jgi:hypothetical protein
MVELTDEQKQKRADNKIKKAENRLRIDRLKLERQKKLDDKNAKKKARQDKIDEKNAKIATRLLIKLDKEEQKNIIP